MKKYIARISEIIKTSAILPSPQVVLKQLLEQYVKDAGLWYHNFHHVFTCQTIIKNLASKSEKRPLEIIPTILNSLPALYINKSGDFAQLLRAYLSFYPHFQTALEPLLLEHIGTTDPYLFTPEQAIKYFIKLIHAKDKGIKQCACEGLGNLHRFIPAKLLPSVLSELINLLKINKDYNPLENSAELLRQAAGDALLKFMPQPQTIIDDIFKTLLSQTHSLHARTKTYALTMLANFANHFSTEQKSALLNLLLQNDNWATSNILLISKLAPFEMRSEQYIVATLIEQLSDTDETKRNLAVATLADIMPSLSLIGRKNIYAHALKLLNKDSSLQLTAIDLYSKISWSCPAEIKHSFNNIILTNETNPTLLSQFIISCAATNTFSNVDAIELDSADEIIKKLYSQIKTGNKQTIRAKACIALSLYCDSMNLEQKIQLIHTFVATLESAKTATKAELCSAISIVIAALPEGDDAKTTAMTKLVELLQSDEIELKIAALNALATIATHIPNPSAMQKTIAIHLLDYMAAISPNQSAPTQQKTQLAQASITATYDLMDLIPKENLSQLSSLLKPAFKHSSQELQKCVMPTFFKLMPLLSMAELTPVMRDLVSSSRQDQALPQQIFSHNLMTTASPINTDLKQDYLLPLLMLENKNPYLLPFNYLNIVSVLTFFQEKLRYLQNTINSAVAVGLSALRLS